MTAMPRDDATPLLDSIAARDGEMRARLREWAEINSGTSNVQGVGRVRELAAQVLRPLADAMEVRPLPPRKIVDSRGNVIEQPVGEALVAHKRANASRRILLCGHLDTVYPADSPFQQVCEIDKNTWNGPGVADMKGGLLTMLAALQAFEETPQAEQLGWDVLLTPDEETGSKASAPLLRDAVSRARLGLVFEPARPNGDIVQSRKGTGVFTAVCRGRAAHAARVPNDGRNAVLALAEFLIGASRIPTEMPDVLVTVATIRGGGPATNVVPDHAEAALDVRISRAADAEALLARFNRLAAEINAREGYTLELRGGFNRPPKECLPVEAALFTEWRRAARDVGVAAFDWVHAGGGSDGNLLAAAGLANLDGLGPIGEHLHSAREYVVVPTIASRAQIAALFLHRVATGEIALPE